MIGQHQEAANAKSLFLDTQSKAFIYADCHLCYLAKRSEYLNPLLLPPKTSLPPPPNNISSYSSLQWHPLLLSSKSFHFFNNTYIHILQHVSLFHIVLQSIYNVLSQGLKVSRYENVFDIHERILMLPYLKVDNATKAVADAMMLPILDQLKTERRTKTLGLAEHSMSARILEQALDANGLGKQLAMPYVDPKQAINLVSVEHLFLPKHDMYEELMNFHDKLHQGDKPFNKWEVEEREHFNQAYNRVRDHIMQNQMLIKSTANTLGGPVIRQYFGHKAKAIVVIHDEAPLEQEPHTWSFLKRANVEKVQEVVLAGDTLQNIPLIKSPHNLPRLNEFARQLSRSLMVRLVNGKMIIVFTLSTQFSMNPELFAMPNQMTYGGRGKDGANTKTLTLTKGFSTVLRQFLNAPRNQPNISIVNVFNGQQEVHGVRKSRRNRTHVMVGMDFIRRLYAASPGGDNRITVIVLYKWQETEWLEAKLRFSQDSDIPVDDLFSVSIAHSMQGLQNDFIINDTVISHCNSMGDLGLAQGEGLQNVIFTRAQRGMMTLYHHEVTTGELANNWKPKKDKSRRGVMEVR